MCFILRPVPQNPAFLLRPLPILRRRPEAPRRRQRRHHPVLPDRGPLEAARRSPTQARAPLPAPFLLPAVRGRPAAPAAEAAGRRAGRGRRERRRRDNVGVPEAEGQGAAGVFQEEEARGVQSGPFLWVHRQE